MPFLGLFSKKARKEDDTLTTLEMVRKAYEDLSEEDKKTFTQSLSDRVHESVAAQERAEGDEDSQTAEDREHEALGEEHAEGEGDVAELHETDPKDKDEDEGEEKPKAEEKGEPTYDDRLKKVEEMLETLLKRETKEDAVAAAKDAVEVAAEEHARELYGIGGGVFADTAGKDSTVGTAAEQARAILRKINR